MKKSKFDIISYIIFAVAMVLLTLLVVPLVYTYKTPEEFNSYISSLGVWGIVIMFFVQVAQIIVAIIPGEVIELVAGILYGWFGGLLFCIAGILVGQSVIFAVVRLLGRNFAEKVAGSKFMQKMSFLQDETKLKTVIFILYFLPGTPKDLLTYIVPLTKINLRDFLIISLVARIPSVASSTYAGSSFAQMNFLNLAITYVVIAFFSVAGLIIYKKWEMRKINIKDVRKDR